MRTEYSLKVMHEGEAFPTETATRATSAEVMEAIPRLLKRHPGCHRIHVYAGLSHLFLVDCRGNTAAG